MCFETRRVELRKVLIENGLNIILVPCSNENNQVLNWLVGLDSIPAESYFFITPDRTGFIARSEIAPGLRQATRELVYEVEASEHIIDFVTDSVRYFNAIGRVGNLDLKVDTNRPRELVDLTATVRSLLPKRDSDLQSVNTPTIARISHQPSTAGA